MARSFAMALAAWQAIRRATFWWSIALAATVAVTIAFWPAFRGASGISAAIDSLPPSVVTAFGLQDFGSPAGFLRGNLYELLVPLLFAIAAIALIEGQTANDEAQGRLEIFLAQPVDRRNLFLARALACLAGLVVIVLATLVMQLVADSLVDLSIDAGNVAATVLMCGLLAALYASIAYLVACLRPKPGLVLGIALALMFAGYVVANLFPIADALKPWKILSPWDWAFGGNPLEHGAEVWRIALLAGVTALLTILGTLLVPKRDVASA